jgi:hypothetical protein
MDGCLLFLLLCFCACFIINQMAIDHTAFVYEMTVPYKGLYVYREVQRFQLPTNRNNVALLYRSVSNFLLFKVCTFM